MVYCEVTNRYTKRKMMGEVRPFRHKYNDWYDDGRCSRTSAYREGFTCNNRCDVGKRRWFNGQRSQVCVLMMH